MLIATTGWGVTIPILMTLSTGVPLIPCLPWIRRRLLLRRDSHDA